MGKSLIIKGADFSNVAVSGEDWILSNIALNVFNGAISRENPNRLSTQETIYVENGKSVKITGIKDLAFNILWYNQKGISSDNLVYSDGNETTWKNNKDGVANTFVITNDRGENCYLALCFAKASNQSETISSADYSPLSVIK